MPACKSGAMPPNKSIRTRRVGQALACYDPITSWLRLVRWRRRHACHGRFGRFQVLDRQLAVRWCSLRRARTPAADQHVDQRVMVGDPCTCAALRRTGWCSCTVAQLGPFNTCTCAGAQCRRTRLRARWRHAERSTPAHAPERSAGAGVPSSTAWLLMRSVAVCWR
jgi:hypothetical protein